MSQHVASCRLVKSNPVECLAPLLSTPNKDLVYYLRHSKGLIGLFCVVLSNFSVYVCVCVCMCVSPQVILLQQRPRDREETKRTKT